MAEIIPFNGVLYNAERVGGFDRVAAPPYDIISPQEQDQLYAASPYNFVRVMLNKPHTNDSETDNPYTRAADDLREWMTTGVLTHDAAPAFYAYRQEFTNPADDQRYTRLGLFCAIKLEPYSAGVVLPHEETRTKAKEDRLNLMRATHANPEPIFGLYEDTQAFVAGVVDPIIGESAPAVEVCVDGDYHRVWRIAQPAAITQIQAFMADRRVWIADGHHRYETGLNYAAERRAADNHPTEPQPYDYLFIVLTAFTDPGIVVLPTHRLVKNITTEKLARITDILERNFDVETVEPDTLEELMLADVRTHVHRFGMVTSSGSYVVTLRDEHAMDRMVKNHVDAWKRLDVSVLQTLVLDDALGIAADRLATTPDIAYTRSKEEALAKVASGEYQIAFLLNLPTADEVRLVAAAGDKMPPKSTFFYPKQWSGLLMRTL